MSASALVSGCIGLYGAIWAYIGMFRVWGLEPVMSLRAAVLRGKVLGNLREPRGPRGRMMAFWG